jgi:hypothetical protein
MVKKKLKIAGLVTLSLLLFSGLALVLLDEPRPTGKGGLEAENLAKKMLKATNAAAWRKTGAVRWTFAGRNQHLWDRVNHRVEVKWSDYRVLLRIHSKTGRAWQGQSELAGSELEDALDQAHKYWINDSFWLNPIAKIFDPGVERQLVKLDRNKVGLLMQFSDGGRTPGDAYLWRLDQDGLPKSWQMWASILPVGGVHSTWSNWQTLSTGARISTTHVLRLFTIEITDLEGAESIDKLCKTNPFERLKSED